MRGAASRYWRWLGTRLGLTLVGRVAFTVVAVLGFALVAGDDLFGGTTGPNVAAILGIYVIFALIGVVGLDAIARLLWLGAKSVRRRRA